MSFTPNGWKSVDTFDPSAERPDNGLHLDGDIPVTGKQSADGHVYDDQTLDMLDRLAYKTPAPTPPAPERSMLSDLEGLWSVVQFGRRDLNTVTRIAEKYSIDARKLQGRIIASTLKDASAYV